MQKNISIPRGTSDILPLNSLLWQDVENKIRQVLTVYNYNEIRTPIYEESKLFKRSLGQTSEVVNKQLLELSSRGEESYALRPEGTAAVVRSYIENRFDKKESLMKFYYMGPMFRGERPQKGRLRQFHQIGVEAIGPDTVSPFLDAEIIALALNILKALGIREGFRLCINTLGSVQDKQKFSEILRTQVKDYDSQLPPELKSSFEQNIFRILDSKDPIAKSIVAKLDINHSYLSKESEQYFSCVQQALDDLNISYEVSPKLVRGLDYYTHTVFEVLHEGLGSQDAVGAGGRYNGLVHQLGGIEADAVGFALGMERMMLIMTQEVIDVKPHLDVYVLSMNEAYLNKTFNITESLRKNGVSAEMNYKISSMKSLMRAANKVNAKYVLIIGEEEMIKNEVTIKDMSSGDQKTISIQEVEGFFQNIH